MFSYVVKLAPESPHNTNLSYGIVNHDESSYDSFHNYETGKYKFIQKINRRKFPSHVCLQVGYFIKRKERAAIHISIINKKILSRHAK